MVQILQVELFERDIPSAVSLMLDRCQAAEKQNLLISASGAHGLVTASQDAQFRLILQSFFLNLPDGMPSVWVGRLKGAQRMQRCYGPDFFREVILASAPYPIYHYFCGGREGVAAALKQVCAERFGNPNIVGFYAPPFREMREAEIHDLADEINRLKTDIVWIGLSTPKQERFAFQLAKYTDVHFICTVGAAFDFYTGRVQQAPKWMQQNGLEWLFRLLVEPRRLWKRYFKIVPLFIIYNLVELFQGKFFIEKQTTQGGL